MKANNLLPLIGMMGVVMVSGCATSPQVELTLCEDPRPEICTREYMPVCGYLAEEDKWRTYANACEACADPQVEGWKPGSCESGK